MLKALFVFGTRPEAIKLAPVIRYMRTHPEDFDVRVAATAQHRQMLDQVLALFDLHPDYDLNVMQPGQSLTGLTARVLSAMEPVIAEVKPDIVYVQGDTTTTMAGALAAFYAGRPVAHVEAGLRTGDLTQPFPEELNRVITGRLTTLHFAATESARRNLLAEGVVPESIHVTGNTGIDAVLDVRDRLASGQLPETRRDFLQGAKHLVVVTAHRRESFGAGFENICLALRQLAAREDVTVVYPVHRNPNVAGPVQKNLAGMSRVHLLEPLDYASFVDLMRRATVILTDSGGIQEEAPSLGKPVIVMREKTERPEGVEAGTVRLAGTDPSRIVREVSRLLDDAKLRADMARIHNPYGDGKASRRIADASLQFAAAKAAMASQTSPSCSGESSG
jgi:UDP-N-acetylglucosamine 2-epimerase (non-hydrolysing)